MYRGVQSSASEAAVSKYSSTTCFRCDSLQRPHMGDYGRWGINSGRSSTRKGWAEDANRSQKHLTLGHCPLSYPFVTMVAFPAGVRLAWDKTFISGTQPCSLSHRINVAFALTFGSLLSRALSGLGSRRSRLWGSVSVIGLGYVHAKSFHSGTSLCSRRAVSRGRR